VHEKKIYYIAFDDFRTQTTRKWHWCVLFDDLKMLWDVGVDVYEDNFCLCAMLFWIIKYFLTYGNLSNSSVIVIMHALYVKKTLVILNWNIGKRSCTLGIKTSFLIVIHIVEWRKHLMNEMRIKLYLQPVMLNKYISRWRTLTLCLERQKRSLLRRIVQRKNQYSF